MNSRTKPGYVGGLDRLDVWVESDALRFDLAFNQ